MTQHRGKSGSSLDHAKSKKITFLTQKEFFAVHTDPLKHEDHVSLTLTIKTRVHYKDELVTGASSV